MMATQFQHLHLLSRTRALLPTPPHPLQEMRPRDPLNFREIQGERSVPVAPPPSPISSMSVHSLNTHSLGNVDPETLSITTTQEGTRWNGFLWEFSQGRPAGWEARDYISFTAIAPRYLPPDIQTSAWMLEQMRGGVPSNLLKLGPGSAISL